MATSRQPAMTESQILTSYLLPPSPLPTILSYSAFLNLVPATYRSNLEIRPQLKRLYRDLQFQRSITIEQVRDNIQRECEERAATLRAKLSRNIAVDEGARDAEREEIQARKEQQRSKGRLTRSENDSDDSDDLMSDADEVHDRRLAAQEALWDDPNLAHPAANVLPLVDGEVQVGKKEAYHTRESLLVALEDTNNSVTHEIDDLEAECSRLRDEIGESVGALSDLRYGKRQSESEQQGEIGEVLEAIAQLKRVIETKTLGRA